MTIGGKLFAISPAKPYNFFVNIIQKDTWLQAILVNSGMIIDYV